MAKTNSSKPRRATRFHPEPLTVAYISLKNKNSFEPTLVGLVLNESYSGCSILVNCEEVLKKDQTLKIKVGELAVMNAQVVWVKILEESIIKLGIKFLE